MEHNDDRAALAWLFRGHIYPHADRGTIAYRDLMFCLCDLIRYWPRDWIEMTALGKMSGSILSDFNSTTGVWIAAGEIGERIVFEGLMNLSMLPREAWNAY